MKVLKDNLATLLATAQVLTNAWANVGDVLNTGDIENIAVYTKLDVNDSQTVLMRTVGLLTADATDVYPIGESGTITDSDQCHAFKQALSDVYPFIRVQTKAGTVGSSAGNVTVNVVGSLRLKV